MLETLSSQHCSKESLLSQTRLFGLCSREQSLLIHVVYASSVVSQCLPHKKCTNGLEANVAKLGIYHTNVGKSYNANFRPPIPLAISTKFTVSTKRWTSYV